MTTKNEFDLAVKSGDNHHTLATKITNSFIEHKNLKLGIQQHRWLKSKIRYTNDYNNLLYENLLLLEFYEEAYVEFNELVKGFINPTYLIKNLLKLRTHLKRNIINGSHLLKLGVENLTALTKFGNENIEEILLLSEKIVAINYPNGFLEQFYILNETGKISGTYPNNYYSKYFQIGVQAERTYRESIKDKSKDSEQNATRNLVEQAIGQESANLLREAENSLRIAIGGKKIGEGYISETELYYKIKSHFSRIDVKQHGQPQFLGRQHFDIWIPELQVAIEYQGAQHDKPINFFGGEKAFLENKKRDSLKRKKCELNNVKLIEVRPGYNLEEIIKEIEVLLGA